MTNWYISRHTTYSRTFGYINIIGSENKWRVAFAGLPEVQEAFDGSSQHHRFFDTPEDAQKAFDAFTFNGVVWEGIDDDGLIYYTGTIAPGVTVTLWNECDDWCVEECSHDDFDLFMREETVISSRNVTRAKFEVIEAWDAYQAFLTEHGGKTYIEVVNAEEEEAA
jgi:hypothetical protein